MVMPIVVYRPTLVIQPLDENGDPDGATVDASCDVESFELGVSIPLTTVVTWCGTFSVPGDLEETASGTFAINDETYDRWAPLIGKTAEFRLKDRGLTDTDYRSFTTEIRANPALYGTMAPGEARTIDLDFPILSSPVLVEGSPS